MNTPEKLSVKLKFRIMLICFAAYAVLTGLSFIYLTKNYNKIDASYKAEIKMKNELAEIRNLQYELFSLYSSARNKEKEDTLTSEIHKLCARIDQGIESLTDIEPELNRKTVQSISILREEFDNYQNKIAEISKIKGENVGKIKGLKKLYHPKYGESLLTAGEEGIIKLWIIKNNLNINLNDLYH